MQNDLDRLAHIYGIASSYESERGDRVLISDQTKQDLLHAMGVDARTPEAIRHAIAEAPQPAGESGDVVARPCFVHEWLVQGRCWGVTCQLYSLHSSRSQGIGDFEDLALLAEIAAGVGADFLGVNPLHALFGADPERASPYSPSSRRFLNPLYIALDPLSTPMAPTGDFVDYASVAAHKRKVLEVLFTKRDPADPAYEKFAEEQGEALQAFATFEALSETLSAQGHGCGWHQWPDDFRDCRSPAVRVFVEGHAELIAFHAWMQWLAASQLAEAQRRALAAGMRIGLYLDLAVGVAPDGMETWYQPDLVVSGARIGAPPDLFNAGGQDWGLAPFSPALLRERKLEPFERDLEAAMRHAGAIRIDHVMALKRLFWIPGFSRPAEGGYVDYPFEEMLAKLGDLSLSHETIVVGEDLGTVPRGFRGRMREGEVQSYRLMLFERTQEAVYAAPDTYPAGALACIATHDLPAFAGWWTGEDIALRFKAGFITDDVAAKSRRERDAERQGVLRALSEAGVLSKRASADASTAEAITSEVVAAAHAFVARTPARLMAAQIEDLVGATYQVNLPGTHREHTNWRRILGTPLEDLAAHPLFQMVVTAIAHERPRPQ